MPDVGSLSEHRERELTATPDWLAIRAGKNRVLRLMREHGLLAPVRRGRPRGDRTHSGRIQTKRPDELWGTDVSRFWTKAEGWCWFFAAVDHCTPSPDFSHEPVGGGWAGDLTSRREWRGHYEAEYRAVIVGCGAERRPGRGVRGVGGSRRGERADRSLRRGEAAGVTVRGSRFLSG